jgi:pimeloyl-ACP methyl ester carboxylesterase
MTYTIKEEGNFRYLEEGEGQPIVLLHGLFGALSNWEGVVEHFRARNKVIIPLLPLYTMPLIKTTVGGLAKHVHDFVERKGYANPVFIGNSLGGHVALVYALKYAEKDDVRAIVLTGSSGLFEEAMGGTYPRRGDYEYIRKKTELTFYDPAMATKELVDELFEIVNTRDKIVRVLAMSKSAMRQNLAEELHKIVVPVQLIWGKDDTITPPHVAEEFQKLMPQAELVFIDKCGHAPMMERPEEFNKLFEDFLNRLPASQAAGEAATTATS